MSIESRLRGDLAEARLSITAAEDARDSAIAALDLVGAHRALLQKERDTAVSSCQQNSAMLFQARQEIDEQRARADSFERAASDYAKTIGTQHESVARIEERVAEQIAAWIESFEPGGVGEQDWPGDLADRCRAGAYRKEPT